MQFMVIQDHQFWYQSKVTCNFLLVSNTNLHPISHHFQIIADWWSNFGCRRGYHCI